MYLCVLKRLSWGGEAVFSVTARRGDDGTSGFLAALYQKASVGGIHKKIDAIYLHRHGLTRDSMPSPQGVAFALDLDRPLSAGAGGGVEAHRCSVMQIKAITLASML